MNMTMNSVYMNREYTNVTEERSNLTVLSVKGLESFYILLADVVCIALSQIQLHKVRQCS